MSKKPRQDFQECLEAYTKALLDLIPIMYKGVPVRGTEDIKCHIKDIRDSLQLCIPWAEETIKKLEEALPLFKAELKHAEEWETVTPPILKKLEESINKLDAITNQYTLPSFRHKFASIDHDDINNRLHTGRGIDLALALTGYLSHLQNEGYDQHTARQRLLIEMNKHEEEYLQQYGGKLAYMPKQGKQPGGVVGHTNAKINLSKRLEYIRLDDHDDKFYAKAKGITSEYNLKLTGQPFQILHCLYNEYNTKTQMASVHIDEVLYQAQIKKHKRDDDISLKRSQLHVKVNAVRGELEAAGFNDDCIKVLDDHCELYINCSYSD